MSGLRYLDGEAISTIVDVSVERSSRTWPPTFDVLDVLP